MLKEKESLIPVLRATRVIKSNGTLLMRPLVQDADFLLSISVLYLERFGTPFHVQSIATVSKGIHLLFKEVTCRKEAEYLVDETFLLPPESLPKDGVEALHGRDVYFEEKRIGVVTGWQQTPVYDILVVTEGEREWRIPITDSFVVIEDERIIIVNGAALEN